MYLCISFFLSFFFSLTYIIESFNSGDPDGVSSSRAGLNDVCIVDPHNSLVLRGYRDEAFLESFLFTDVVDIAAGRVVISEKPEITLVEEVPAFVRTNSSPRVDTDAS